MNNKIKTLSDHIYLACRPYDTIHEPSYYIYAHHILQWLNTLDTTYYMSSDGYIYYNDAADEIQDLECRFLLSKPLHLQPEDTIEALFEILPSGTLKQKRVLALKKKLGACDSGDCCNVCRVCKYTFYIEWANGMMNGESDITREPLIEEYLRLINNSTL